MTETSVYSHLYAIEDRIMRETDRLKAAENAPRQNAKTAREIAFRKHEIMMANRELENEKKFLRDRGIEVIEVDNMSDDELLAELGI